MKKDKNTIPLEARRTDLRKRKHKSINRKKIEDETFAAMRERFALNWFLKRFTGTRLAFALKKHILCMDLNEESTHPFSVISGSQFKYLNEKEKETVRFLRKNEKMVDAVMHSIFQWFGSPVGLEHITSLSKFLQSGYMTKHWEKLEKQRKARLPKEKISVS